MDTSLWVGVPLGALTAVVIAAHYFYKNAFSYWAARGIKGPKAYPLIGNFNLMMLDKGLAVKWAREFGKVYGVYESRKPVLVVSDPEVMQQLCIKDFNKFPNHPFQEFGTELSRKFIFSTDDDHWRRVRAILSPTFTSGKMRRMFRLLDVCADDMVGAMHKRLESSSVVNLKDLFGLYTMDAIASCCYGLRLMGYKDEASLTTAANSNDFVKLGLRLFNVSMWRVLMIVCLPTTILERFGIGFFAKSVEWDFARRVQQIIKKRCESGKNFDDYLQTLIDAKLEAGDESKSGEDHLDHLENHHVGGGSDHQKLRTDKIQEFKGQDGKLLSEMEVLSSATFLLVVGLETTSTLLTHCFYALSFHQEIQEKLYQTIKSIAKLNDQNEVSFDYDSLTSCQYLDAVLSETLRLHPSAPQTDRCASDDYYLESQDLHLPKGSKVIFTMNAMMRDPDYWSKPDIYDPERFMPEQARNIVPGSYCPFGIGPRHCLGMRFSLTESKIALAKLLMKFKFEPAPGLSYPPEMRLQFGFTNIKRPEATVIRR